jgi:hypothetical protein
MEVRLVYSNIQFMKSKNVACTLLAVPIKVRLYVDDLVWLEKMGADPTDFIREVIHKTITEIKTPR